MALIEFQDLPNTTTPLTASNLNNNFDYLDDKIDTKTSRAYIMVYLNTNTTLSTTAWVSVDIPFNAVKFNYGNKFSLNTSTNVVSYSGDRQLKITIHATSNDTTSSYYPVCSVASVTQEAVSSTEKYATNVIFGSASTIKGRIAPRTTGNQTLMGDANNTYTYMIVEEI